MNSFQGQMGTTNQTMDQTGLQPMIVYTRPDLVAPLHKTQDDQYNAHFERSRKIGKAPMNQHR